MFEANCRFFAIGKCIKGENCPFKHDKKSNDIICEFFRRGECVYGSSCLYKHDDNEGAANSVNYSDVKIANLCDEHLDNLSDMNSADEDVVTPEVVYITLEELNNSNATKKEKALCPFALSSYCSNIWKCDYLHGFPCDTCGKLALHPTNEEERKKHITKCIKEFEDDMNLAFNLSIAKQITCCICLDNVIKEDDDISNPKERFGLLVECNHAFCLGCIKSWRQSKDKSVDTAAKRACPICRTFSGYIIPSYVWPETAEMKNEIIENFKNKLKDIPCKYFNESKGNCPFKNSCFYKHALPDGTLADRSQWETLYYGENGVCELKPTLLIDLFKEFDI